jgi:thioredoxin-like negative regulator of GroEL
MWMWRIFSLAVMLMVLGSEAQAANKVSEEEAGRYTCEDVRWAKDNLSKVAVNLIKARMTRDQLDRAKACLSALPASVHAVSPPRGTSSW